MKLLFMKKTTNWLNLLKTLNFAPFKRDFMTPKQIKKTDNNSLIFTWSDGNISELTYKKLRDSCPCANCSGESVILHSVKPQKIFLETPGRYDLKDIQPVGNYAITLVWGDNHNTGIFSWDLLYRLAKLAEALEAQAKQKQKDHDHHHDHNHPGNHDH